MTARSYTDRLCFDCGERFNPRRIDAKMCGDCAGRSERTWVDWMPYCPLAGLAWGRGPRSERISVARHPKPKQTVVPKRPVPSDKPVVVARTYECGTSYSYQTLKCKCERCRAWSALKMREYRARMVKRPLSHVVRSTDKKTRGRPSVELRAARGENFCGTWAGYLRFKCRCDRCKGWNAARARDYRKKHPEATAQRHERYQLAHRVRKMLASPPPHLTDLLETVDPVIAAAIIEQYIDSQTHALPFRRASLDEEPWLANANEWDDPTADEALSRL